MVNFGSEGILTVARVISVAASLPHFCMSLSTLMIRFTRIRGSCVVSSRPWEALLELGGGVGVICNVGALA